MAIEVAVEEVAANLEEIAEATRKINAAGLGYLGGGILIGGVLGFVIGYKVSKKKIRDEALAEADAEIENMRENFQARFIAREEKPALDDLIGEHGYDMQEYPEGVPPALGRLPAPVPVSEAFTDTGGDHPPRVNYSTKVPDIPLTVDQAVILELDELPQVNYGLWDYGRETDNRSPGHPYVIHKDEFDGSEHEYEKVAYVYYAVDDVVAGEDSQPIIIADQVVGLDNLKWGHGSDDPNTVYIRNDRLEIEIELTRRNASYEHEVMGLDDADTP